MQRVWTGETDAGECPGGVVAIVCWTGDWKLSSRLESSTSPWHNWTLAGLPACLARPLLTDLTGDATTDRSAIRFAEPQDPHMGT